MTSTVIHILYSITLSVTILITEAAYSICIEYMICYICILNLKKKKKKKKKSSLFDGYPELNSDYDYDIIIYLIL